MKKILTLALVGSFLIAGAASAQVVDVCPNISGSQATVPDGYELNSSTGECDALRSGGGTVLTGTYYFLRIGDDLGLSREQFDLLWNTRKGQVLLKAYYLSTLG